MQTLPIWVSATGYVETQPNRTKVGDEQSRTRAAILELATGAVNWVDPGLGRRQLSVRGVGWSASGSRALVRGMAADFNDRWLWVVDVPGFAVRQVDVLHDSAWVAQLSYRPDGYLTARRSGSRRKFPGGRTPIPSRPRVERGAP
ncbi:MAG: hypothetical protein Q8Q85_03280 [Gemmatimonadales bacterium]|nr:hypothetical protein [Gemmatimonadales bacterium]